jgi:uncharacterized protein YhbP (UPF0306 family)
MTEALQQEISDFIRGSKVATISCSDGSFPHSFCCFYACSEDGVHLVFKSKQDTKHCRILRGNPCVSGTIISGSATAFNNTGIQFEGGIVRNPAWVKQVYYQLFPLAVVMPGDIYTIRMDKIKYTRTVNGKRIKYAWTR